MSERTRARKIAPKGGNDYKQAELEAAAKGSGVKDVGLPSDMFPKGKFKPLHLGPLEAAYVSAVTFI